MKITAFNPLICSTNPEPIIKLMEELGFEIKHEKEGIEGDIKSTDMVMGDFRVDVAAVHKVPQDLTAIRINVDNFQEAYDYFISKGFTNPRGDAVTDTKSSKATLLFSPSGFAVNICEHTK
ncbi:hypothetical protein [Butyrivibrio sp. JL13D10]|uniref:hypothetical protein n=1 Tax=Butyrivibrio sp. JL13D10 TaxID=3236815 RepID=UPI0038B4311A